MPGTEDLDTLTWDALIAAAKAGISAEYTHAQKQVLPVGNEAAAKAAVESPPRVQSRQVSLDG